MLRALLDGRVLHDGDALDLRDRDGGPLDLERGYAPDASDHDIAHHLAEAGVVTLRSWLDPAALPGVRTEVRAAAERSAPGDPGRWWSRLASGEQRCTRVMRLLDESPTMRELVEGPVFARLARLFDDGHRVLVERDQACEALVKPLDVEEGLADLPLHRDCSMGGCDYTCSAYAVGLPLSPTNDRYGHLRALAGSHRVSMPLPGTVPGYDPGLAFLDVLTEPGDITIHLSCVLHGTRPPSAHERTVVYTTFALEGLPDDDTVGPPSEATFAAGGTR